MKKRIDLILTENNYVASREKAKALIMANKVLINNDPVLKPGQLYEEIGIKIKIKSDESSFVSRGGLKLDKGIKLFNIDVNNKICIDIGSSTGGFTDCLLQNNAAKIYSIDVGTNQLDWKIRSNSKVISMEKTNFRYIDPNLFLKENITFVCCDVSFISLTKIIPNISLIINSNSLVFLLIKPQFETTRENVDRGGVVNNKKIHLDVINKIINFASNYNLLLSNLSFSPITGNKKSNIEYIALFTNKKNNINQQNNDKIIMSIINEAWDVLK